MRNIYLYIYSKFYYFTAAINKSRFYAAIVAVGILSGFPILNIMVLLTNVFNVDYNRYKKVYVISFIIVYLINFFFIVLMKEYENIETNYTVSKRSKVLSNILVIAYILTSFVLLFV